MCCFLDISTAHCWCSEMMELSGRSLSRTIEYLMERIQKLCKWVEGLVMWTTGGQMAALSGPLEDSELYRQIKTKSEKVRSILPSMSLKFHNLRWYNLNQEDLDEDYLCFCSHVPRNPGQNNDVFPDRTPLYVQTNPLMTHWGNSVKSVFRSYVSLVSPWGKRRKFLSHLLSKWWRNQSDLIRPGDSWWSPVRWPQTLG